MKRILFLGLAFFIIFGFTGCSLSGLTNVGKSGKILTIEEAKIKAKEFVNEYLIPEGQPSAELSEIKEENNLYKIKVKVAGQEVDSYMTKDAKLFFPQAIDMENPEEFFSQSDANSQVGAQQQMSLADQAGMMVTQARGLLERYGSDITAEEKQSFEDAINALEEITKDEEPDEQELQNKMQDVQNTGKPIIELIQSQQQSPVQIEQSPATE